MMLLENTWGYVQISNCIASNPTVLHVPVEMIGLMGNQAEPWLFLLFMLRFSYKSDFLY